MTVIRWWFFDRMVKLILWTRWGKYIHTEAWYGGWEQRAMIKGPACPDDYYPGSELSDDRM